MRATVQWRNPSAERELRRYGEPATGRSIPDGPSRAGASGSRSVAGPDPTGDERLAVPTVSPERRRRCVERSVPTGRIGYRVTFASPRGTPYHFPLTVTTNDESRVSDVEYDPSVDAYTATFDPAELSANTAVVESVAAVHHRDPLDIDPLYEYVDTDALDALIRASPGKQSPYLSTSFRFEDADVTVRGDGTIVIAPDDDFG